MLRVCCLLFYALPVAARGSVLSTQQAVQSACRARAGCAGWLAAALSYCPDAHQCADAAARSPSQRVSARLSSIEVGPSGRARRTLQAAACTWRRVVGRAPVRRAGGAACSSTTLVRRASRTASAAASARRRSTPTEHAAASRTLRHTIHDGDARCSLRPPGGAQGAVS